MAGFKTSSGDNFDDLLSPVQDTSIDKLAGAQASNIKYLMSSGTSISERYTKLSRGSFGTTVGFKLAAGTDVGCAFAQGGTVSYNTQYTTGWNTTFGTNTAYSTSTSYNTNRTTNHDTDTATTTTWATTSPTFWYTYASTSWQTSHATAVGRRRRYWQGQTYYNTSVNTVIRPEAWSQWNTSRSTNSDTSHETTYAGRRRRFSYGQTHYDTVKTTTWSTENFSYFNTTRSTTGSTSWATQFGRRRRYHVANTSVPTSWSTTYLTQPISALQTFVNTALGNTSASTGGTSNTSYSTSVTTSNDTGTSHSTNTSLATSATTNKQTIVLGSFPTGTLF